MRVEMWGAVRWRSPIFAMVAAIVLVTTVAEAQPRATREANNLVTTALSQLQSGDFRDAASLFLQAYALDARTEYVLSAARALDQGGRGAEALNLYAWYQQLDPDSTENERIERRRTHLQRRVRHSHGQVECVSEPPGAEVSLVVNGARFGRTPVRFWLPRGRVQIALEYPGFPPVVQEVVVQAGGTARLEATFSTERRTGRGTLRILGLSAQSRVAINGQRVLPEPRPKSLLLPAGSHRLVVVTPNRPRLDTRIQIPADGVVTVDVADRGPATASAAPDLAEEPPSSGSGLLTAGWVLIGVGLAGAAAAGVIHGLGASNDREELRMGAYIGYGASGAFLVTGVILAASGAEDATEPGISFGVYPAPSGGLMTGAGWSW